MLTLYASAIDYKYIYIFCPNPLCKSTCHIYRSNGSLTNRTYKTFNHCFVENSPKKVKIVVNPCTLRTSVNCYRNGSFCFSKRSFKKSLQNMTEKEVRPIAKLSKVPILVKFD